MSLASAFSPDYVASRARFRSDALALDCELASLPIQEVGPDGEALTIDIAVLGSNQPKRAVVVSSGLHGVEGFLGAAVQARLMEEELGGYRPPGDAAVVFLHALNPYGYAWTRRVNEENIDLNRNFLLKGQEWTGAPEGYAELDSFLNPPSAPRRFELFRPRAIAQIAKHGFEPLKNAVAGGQYAFPEGLFFGGSGPSKTMELLDQHLAVYLGLAENVVHIDFHTGLGKRADYKLFADRAPDHPRYAWLKERFGHDKLEPWTSEGTSYDIRGGLGKWLQQRFPRAEYDVLTAEFGTTHILNVIKALHRENRAHHYGVPETPSYVEAKRGMIGAFAPTDLEWRETSVSRGVRIVEQAIEAVLE